MVCDGDEVGTANRPSGMGGINIIVLGTCGDKHIGSDPWASDIELEYVATETSG
jgi:hypothetical protein